MSASKYRLYSQLQRAAHRLKTEADASLTATAGLTTAQAAMLMIVLEDGPVSQKHVAMTLSQRESAITAMARRLLAMEYVTRRKSQTDARSWLLDVTPEGRAAIDRVRPSFAKINARIDRCLSGQDMAQFAGTLDQLISAFGDDDQQ